MKTLVTYFSRTGQTTRVAKEIARRCDGHVDAICPQYRSDSWLGAWRSGWQALVQAEPPVQRPLRNPAAYDLVIIGVPVWRVGLAAPVRSYVREYASRFKQIAFFCVEGKRTETSGFAELARLCGKKPIAVFTVARKHLPTAAHRKDVFEFVESVRGQSLDL